MHTGVVVIATVLIVGSCLNRLTDQILPCFRPITLYTHALASPWYLPSLTSYNETTGMVTLLDVDVRTWSSHDILIVERHVPQWVRAAHENEFELSAGYMPNNPMFWCLLYAPLIVLASSTTTTGVLFSPTSPLHDVLHILIIALLAYHAAIPIWVMSTGCAIVMATVAVPILPLLHWRQLRGVLLLGMVVVSCRVGMHDWTSFSMGPHMLSQWVLAFALADCLDPTGTRCFSYGLTMYTSSMWLYTAAVTKVAACGWRWCDGNYLKLLMIAYSRRECGGTFNALQRFMLAIPNELRIIAMAIVLALEFMAPLMWFPRTRPFYLGALASFFTASTVMFGAPIRCHAFF